MTFSVNLAHAANNLRVVQRNGPTNEIALYLIALEVSKRIRLLHRFHPFCDDQETESASEPDDSADNHGRILGYTKPLHEGLVNLDVVELNS